MGSPKQTDAPDDLTPLEGISIGDFERFRTTTVREARRVRRELTKISVGLEDFNGAGEALHRLMPLIPRLEAIVDTLTPDRLTTLGGLADEAYEDVKFWLGVRKRLTPLRPFGAIVWLCLTALVFAGGSELIRIIATGHP